MLSTLHSSPSHATHRKDQSLDAVIFALLISPMYKNLMHNSPSAITTSNTREMLNQVLRLLAMQREDLQQKNGRFIKFSSMGQYEH